MPSQIALIVGVLAAAGLAVGALVLRAASRPERRRTPGASPTASSPRPRRDAETRAQELLAAAQEKALAGEEDNDRRERDLDAREAKIETLARQRESELAAVERQRKDVERRQNALAASEERARSCRCRPRRRSAPRRAARSSASRGSPWIRPGPSFWPRSRPRRAAKRRSSRGGSRTKRREGADRAARRLVVDATQRVSMKEAVESTISFVALPSDEMKGRIIGREGRNIRALEMATGIDVIIDDTPGAILLSSFDPVRREIARVAIQRLLEDGRIHPARIEEVVAKVREEFETLDRGSRRSGGVRARRLRPAPQARAAGRAPQVPQLPSATTCCNTPARSCTSRRTSPPRPARAATIVRRAALLHEIGRVEDGGSGHPVRVAAELAAKFGERDEIVKAIEALHPDAEPRTVEALILRVANRISENRPGARKDNLDVFVERLQRIEALACALPRRDPGVRA